MNASDETTVATTSGKRESVPPDDPRSGPGTTFREMRALAERRAREDELALSPGERDFEQLTHELSVHQIELQLQNEQLRAIQRELEESRDRYRDLFENAPLGYVALRFDGIVERANQKACTLLGWQEKDGAWPVKAWMRDGSQEGPAYATAFATLALYVPEARLSIYNRTPPRLPKGPEERK